MFYLAPPLINNSSHVPDFQIFITVLSHIFYDSYQLNSRSTSSSFSIRFSFAITVVVIRELFLILCPVRFSLFSLIVFCIDYVSFSYFRFDVNYKSGVRINRTTVSNGFSFSIITKLYRNAR